MASTKILLGLVLAAIIAVSYVDSQGLLTSPPAFAPRTPMNPLAPETITMQQSERRLRELLTLVQEKIRQLMQTSHSTSLGGGAMGGAGMLNQMGIGGTMGGLGGMYGMGSMTGMGGMGMGGMGMGGMGMGGMGMMGKRR